MVLGRRLARSGFCFYKGTLAAVWRIDYTGGKSRDKKSQADRKGAGRDVRGGPVSGAPRKQAGGVASATEEGAGALEAWPALPSGRRLRGAGTGWPAVACPEWKEQEGQGEPLKATRPAVSSLELEFPVG